MDIKRCEHGSLLSILSIEKALLMLLKHLYNPNPKFLMGNVIRIGHTIFNHENQ
jgi:hypothetical protein